MPRKNAVLLREKLTLKEWRAERKRLWSGEEARFLLGVTPHKQHKLFEKMIARGDFAAAMDALFEKELPTLFKLLGFTGLRPKDVDRILRTLGHFVMAVERAFGIDPLWIVAHAGTSPLEKVVG